MHQETKLAFAGVQASMALVALLGGCTRSPAESVGAAASTVDQGGYDPGTPDPAQTDDWSCSVHTTAWMLAASGYAATYDDVKSRMLSTGRVTPAAGLSDASGAGIVLTLEDFDASIRADNTGYASFDDVATRAGSAPVGIGGRAWNHWVAVRGYDGDRDLLLLANSAPGYRGVYSTLDRATFQSLGRFSMVWMSAAPAVQPSPTPPDGPFAALLVKTAIPSGEYVTQCDDAGGESVWTTTASGPDNGSRWAAAVYPQTQSGACGDGSSAHYPLVFRSASAGAVSAWVTRCSGTGVHEVFRIEDEVVDGHPAATFQYPEADEACP